MLRATGASEATVCRLSISLPCRANSTKRCEEIVAQRVADVAGDAERAAVVHQRLGRVLLVLVGEQPAEVGHQLLLRFAELAQLPRHEEPRGEPLQAPAGTLLGRRFQQPLEELAHQRRLAARAVAADEAVLVITVGDVIEGVAHQHAAAAIAVGFVLAAAQKGQVFIDAGGQRRLGEGRGRVGPAMIVAAGGQRFLPGLRPVRLDALPVGHRARSSRA